MKNYKKLQNGSDIRGIAMTGVEGELPNLTYDEAKDIARGFMIWLCEKLDKTPSELKIAIGRDPRISGKNLLDGLMNAFGPYNVHGLNCGLASTPAMFMSTIFPQFECDGSIMITASHLPFNRNGLKFFSKEGGLESKEIKIILNNFISLSNIDFKNSPINSTNPYLISKLEATKKGKRVGNILSFHIVKENLALSITASEFIITSTVKNTVISKIKKEFIYFFIYSPNFCYN